MDQELSNETLPVLMVQLKSALEDGEKSVKALIQEWPEFQPLANTNP
jgi:hypothetical protein